VGVVSGKDVYNDNKGLYRHYAILFVVTKTFTQIRTHPFIYLPISRLVRNTKTIDGQSVNRVYNARYTKVYLVFCTVYAIVLLSFCESTRIRITCKSVVMLSYIKQH